MSEIGLVALSMGTYCSMCRAMRTFDETAAALGAPLSLVAFDDIHDRKLIVTRWQHGDVRVARSHADALRVVVNLKRTPVFHFVQAEYSTSITRSAGDITVVPPGDRGTPQRARPAGPLPAPHRDSTEALNDGDRLE